MNTPGNTDKDILLVSIFTFMTVISWIFFELVKTAKTTTVTHSVQRVISPINPELDTNIFTILEERKTY